MACVKTLAILEFQSASLYIYNDISLAAYIIIVKLIEQVTSCLQASLLSIIIGGLAEKHLARVVLGPN